MKARFARTAYSKCLCAVRLCAKQNRASDTAKQNSAKNLGISACAAGILTVSVLALVGCGNSLNDTEKTANQTAQAASLNDSAQDNAAQDNAAKDKPSAADLTVPDLNAPSVITTTTIAIKNHAEYENAEHLPYANPNAPQGGTLAMTATGAFNSANAFIDDGVAAAGTYYLYDTLMTGSLDEAFVLYPQLASAITRDVNDPSWVVYHINPKARFWDGTQVTAADVQATFEAILDKGLMSWRGFLAGIRAVRALDDGRVIFYFHDHASPEMFANVGLMPVFAKADIDARFTKVSLTPLMGSGAYRLTKIEPSRLVEYTKDPNYWGADVMANRGRFNFERIRFVYYQDEAVASEAFLAGQFNLLIESSPARFNALPTPKGVVKQSFTNTNPVPMQGLVMNTRRALFADVKVRRALNLAFDWSWAKSVPKFVNAKRLNSYFYGSKLAATGAPSDKEREVLLSLPLDDVEKSALVGTPSYLQIGKPHSHRENLLLARQLLLQAGFRYQTPDGKPPNASTPSVLVDKKGVPVRFEILLDSDEYAPLLLPFVRNLARLGIDARLRRMERASFITAKRAFDYDLIVDSFMQGNSPGAEQAYLWGSAAADEAGNQNSIGVKSAAVDEVIARLIAADNRADIVLYTKVLDRLLLAGEYMIPWGGENATYVMYKDITPPPRTPQASLGLDYWYRADTP
ncbi:ABC-type oligopeptide transport system, periplasmic component [Moraxella caviae]|nr:ABC-type oligopeptide transport system, periplasmic component [Moraxella caviae]VEW14026.1 ABC-type oligopeptide transport system, periplasmic component [Moraxella caviae]